MSTVALPDLGTMAQAALRAQFGKLVVIRLVIAPIIAALLGTAAWLDPAPWRVVLATALLVGVSTLFGGEYVRYRLGHAGPDALPYNVVAMLWLQLGAVVVTGGLDSPVAPILPMVVLQLSLMFDIGYVLFAVVGAQISVVWALAALYSTGTSLAIPVLGAGYHEPAWPWVVASAYTFLLVAASLLGSRIRRMMGGVVERAIGANDSERLAHAEHAREMLALTGEIAHELKNPLASIKGLASLLARDLDGKSAERLAVLRTEVDRMQETLEDFLGFSRPIVPLSVGEVDLQELAREVVELCDGMAQGRGVRLVAGLDPGRVTADRRKIRQVLVNLVQNAIEAAPAGTEVQVRASTGRVEVLDRGPGIPDELSASVFDPGVTTRDRGSGLGLTIARALVQQHGGTLALEPREGGGLRAVVAL